MALFITTLKAGGPAYRIEPLAEGFAIHRVPGEEKAFETLARKVLDHAGADFVALPRLDDAGVYDSVQILPIH